VNARQQGRDWVVKDNRYKEALDKYINFHEVQLGDEIKGNVLTEAILEKLETLGKQAREAEASYFGWVRRRITRQLQIDLR
jgi:hypothetical protein